MSFLPPHAPSPTPDPTPIYGAATSVFSVIVSLLPHLETGLRISVLLVGLIAGVASLKKALQK